MDTFVQSFLLSTPLFTLVAVGYFVVKVMGLKPVFAKRLSAVVFGFALPVLLFETMTRFHTLATPDWRVLAAFIGGCLLVFGLGRLWAPRLAVKAEGRSIFAISGVFSNNVMLGLPLARLVLGEASVPTVALVLSFNALILWTLVTVSVEWSRHGGGSLSGLAKTVGRVAINPIVAGIVLGLGWSFTGWELNPVVAEGMRWVGNAAGPLALLALGMGMAEYPLGGERRVTGALVTLKLIAHPLVVWGLAVALGLGPLEVATLVLLASISLGSNVYLMARQFGALEGPVAQGLLGSTVLSAITTPVFLSLVR